MDENHRLKISHTVCSEGIPPDFLRNTAVTALAGTALAACSVPDSNAQVVAKGNNADHSGGTMAPNPAPLSPRAASDEMDRMHEAGIKAFPGKDRRKGQPGDDSHAWRRA